MSSTSNFTLESLVNSWSIWFSNSSVIWSTFRASSSWETPMLPEGQESKSSMLFGSGDVSSKISWVGELCLCCVTFGGWICLFWRMIYQSTLPVLCETSLSSTSEASFAGEGACSPELFEFWPFGLELLPLLSSSTTSMGLFFLLL